MSKKYLDSNGLLYFWQKIKNTFALKTDVPGPATTSPKMDGTAAVGSSSKYAKEDHVHPTDTSRVPTSRKVAGHALSADVTISKSDVGLGNVDNTADADKVVASAGKLTEVANIDGVDFDGSADVVRYGVCSTAAATGAKTVTLEGSTPFKLVTGASVFVKFSATNSAAVANLTLNVNSTGAKAIKRYGTTTMASAGNLTAGMVCQFVYDGTNWLWVGHVDTNTTYSNASLGQGYGTCDTDESTAAKVVTMSGYALTAGGVVAVLFTKGCKSIGSLNINSKGAKYVKFLGHVATSSSPLSIMTMFEVTSLSTNTLVFFVYDGTNYVYLGSDVSGSEHPMITLADVQGSVSSGRRYINGKVLHDAIADYVDENVNQPIASIEDSAGYIRILGYDGTYYNAVPLNTTTGVIDSEYLPSYVDDVVEAYPMSLEEPLSETWLSETTGPDAQALTPAFGKIYSLMTASGDYAAGSQFRWGGTTYVQLIDSSGVSEITNTEIDTIVAS